MPAPRPELENPPEVFYNASEARKYTVSTRVRKIQRDMTLRALELLNLPKDEGGASAWNRSSLLLDIGCGSGLSGDALTEQGHAWIGVDISEDMLRIAKEDELHYYDIGSTPTAPAMEEALRTGTSNTRVDTSHVKWGLVSSEDGTSEEGEEEEEEGEGGDDGRQRGDAFRAGVDAADAAPADGPHMVEVLQNDIGAGLPFRPGTFDGCISISVLQWLCHSTKRGQVPQRRLMALFQSLYNALRRGAKAVFQFYPSDPEQVHLITRAAMKCGFNGGVVVDFPHSARAKKYYLVLQAGQVAGGFVPPPALTATTGDSEEDEENDSGDSGEDDVEYSGSAAEDEEEEGEAEGWQHMDSRKRVRVDGRVSQTHSKRSRDGCAPARKRHRKDNRPVTGSREWVLLKKEERRRRGYKTTTDSKYTLRQRKPRF